MVYDGYLALGGQEIANNARTRGYAQTAACPLYWFKGEICEGVWDALNETYKYLYSNVTLAPWYDSVNADVSSRFYGVFIIGLEGIENSTRQRAAVEGIGDGGLLGPTRKAVRQIRVKAMLVADGRDALEYGMAWLSRALDPDACGQHGTGCGTVDLQFFAECPPTKTSITVPSTSWSLVATNQHTNPSFEGAGAAVVARTNYPPNPSYETSVANGSTLRTNHITNPKPTAGWTGDYGTTGAGAVTYLTGSGLTAPLPTEYARATWSAAATALGGFLGSPLTASLPVGVYYASIWVRTSQIQNMRIQAAGTAVVTWTAQPTVVTVANTWTQLTATITVTTAGTLQLQAAAAPGGHLWAIGETLDVSGAIIAQYDSTVPYFDGNTAAAGDLNYAYTGTANASTSIERGASVSNVTVPVGATSTLYSSADTPFHGTKILRHRLNVATAATLTVSDHTQTSAATYTMLGRVRPKTRTMSFTPVIRSTAGTPFSAPVGVWTEFRATIVAGAGTAGSTTGLNILAGAGHAVNDLVDIDQILITDGVYVGPYFDGATLPKLRRNLATNPSFEAGLTSWAASGATHAVSTAWKHGGAQSDLVTNTSAAVGTGDVRLSTGSATVLPPNIEAGKTYTVSAWINTPAAHTGFSAATSSRQRRILYWYSTNGSTLVEAFGPQGDNVAGAQRLSHTFTVPANATGVIIGVGVAGSATDNPFLTYVDDILIEESAVLGTYFDGDSPNGIYSTAWEGTAQASVSYLWDTDFTVNWLTTANASNSQMKGLSVNGITATSAFAVQSNTWASDRARALRIGSLTPAAQTAYVVLHNWTAANAGKTYTVRLKVYQDTLYTTTPNVNHRSLFLTQSVAPTSTQGPQAANALGEQTLTWTFTLAATLTSGTLRFYHGGTGADGDIWLDSLSIVEGTAEDTPSFYFDGASPNASSPPMRFLWTGAADGSTSTWETGQVVNVPSETEWAKQVTALKRYVHDVGATSGPLITEEHAHNGFFANQVEFMLTAEKPWVYKVTEDLPESIATPVVIQDIPFNLVPYPSAEIAGANVVVSTNLATNPSIESAITGWVAATDGTKILIAQVAVSQTTELKSVGTYAAKALFTANTTSTLGQVALDLPVTLTGITATTRYSANLWASANIQSGTAVLGTIDYFVVWQDAGLATLRADLIGSGPAGGGAKSLKGLLPPANTTRAILRAVLNVTSWSTGALIRLYADAAALTNP